MGSVLLSAPADKPFSWGPHLYRALKDIRPDAAFFDFRSCEDPNAELLEAVEREQPLVHIAWKGEVFRPEVFRELSARGVFTLLWHPDETNPQWLPPLARASDLFVTQYKGMTDVYRAAGIERIAWLLDGFTPSFFACDEVTPVEHRVYDCEVVTIGTIDRIPEYRKRMYALNRLIRDGLDVKWWGRRMSFWRNPWRDWLSPARKAYGGAMVWNDTFTKACRCAKIFLALTRRPDVSGGLSNRAFWVTGVGAFTLMLYKQGIEEFFEVGKEVVAFHDHDEMVEMARYYLEHEDERLAIARAGQERCLRDYTNQRLLGDFLKELPQHGGPEV